MSRLLTLTLLFFGLMTSSNAAAQVCDGLLGTQVSPTAYEQARLLVVGGRNLVKDEFETTSHFDARVAAANSPIPESLFISVPFDGKYITYNADNAAFDVKSYAFDNGSFLWQLHLDAASNSILGTGGYNAEYILGENSYVTATSVETRLYMIFDREVAEREGLFEGSSSPKIWTIPTPIDQARGMKERFRAALLVVPRAPFYLEHSRTTRFRRDETGRSATEVTQVIAADIQCAVITDDNNKVLLTIRTN